MPRHLVVSAPAPTHSSPAHSPSSQANSISSTVATTNISNTRDKGKVMAILNMAHRQVTDSTHKAATVQAMDKVATMQHMVY